MARDLSSTRRRSVELARLVVLGKHSQAEQLARRVLQKEAEAQERRAEDAARQLRVMQARSMA